MNIDALCVALEIAMALGALRMLWIVFGPGQRIDD